VQGLSATLQAAQRRPDVAPVITALVGDYPPEVPRLSELASAYNGTEPDSPFDAGFVKNSGLGRIVRIRLTGGTCYAQVVTPNQFASWSTWTTLDAGAGNWAGTQQCAVWCSQDGSNAVYAFWVAADGHTVRYATYNGASWSAFATVVDAGAGFLVSGLASDGVDPTPRLYYAVAGGALNETHWTGAAWSAPVGDGLSWTSPTIGAGFRPTTAPSGDGDGWVLVANGNPTQLSVEQFKITSGSGWAGSPTVILATGPGTGYGYAYPHLSESRQDSPRACLTWSQTAPAPIGTSPVTCFTPSHVTVTGQLPWRYGGSYGVKVFRDESVTNPQWWVVNAYQVYSCPADAPSIFASQRVSFAQSQIVSCAIRQPGDNKQGGGTLTVLNPAGVLNDAGVIPGFHQALRQWSQVAIALGYHTSAGVETIQQVPLWIDAIEFHDDPKTGTPLVTFHLVDAWALLERLRFQTTITYLSYTAEQLIDLMMWWVCGTVGGTGNSRLTGLTLSSFTLKAGETLAVAMRRLLTMTGVVLVFRSIQNGGPQADGIGPGSVGVVGVSRATSGSVYSYGAAGQHPILYSHIRARATPAATSVEVAGATTTSLARNWPVSWLLWRDLEVRVVNKSLAAQAQTDAVSADEASFYNPETISGFFQVLANVGQEVQDQVTVTVATAPLSAQLVTVDGYDVAYNQRDGRIIQTLSLVGTN
jgi:hypothetical protein